VQGGSGIGAKFHQAARHGERARDLSRCRDFRRFANVEKQHVAAAKQFLGFLRADPRHLGVGFGQHCLDRFHRMSPPA
jgi:hypothetical protein